MERVDHKISLRIREEVVAGMSAVRGDSQGSVRPNDLLLLHQ